MSSSIYKANFIQMSTDNVRVIDANALVAKKLESYNALLKAQSEAVEEPVESPDGFSAIDITDLVTDVISEEEIIEEDPQISEMAQSILEQANEEAEAIKNAALAEADSIRENAQAQGYEEGYAQAREAANQELMAARAELENERAAMLSEFEKSAKEIEPVLVSAITKIYEKVFSDNFYNHQEVIVHLIHKALMNSDTETGGAVLVSEDDIDFVEEAKETIFARVNNAQEWEIKVSAKLTKGQAKIETSKGLIDCGIDTQLKELSRTLQLLSYED